MAVGLEAYRAWFSSLEVLVEDPHVLRLATPFPEIADTLEQKYRPLIDQVAAEVADRLKVVIVVRSDWLPAGETVWRLDPRLTFERFVVGEANELAHTAAMAVAETPFEHYNPLLVFGGTGVGKTHLLHAIGQAIIERHPNRKVHFSSAGEFVERLVEAIRCGSLKRFRDYLLTFDVLLVDDFERVALSAAVQEEIVLRLFHPSRIQVVVAAASPPRGIPKLDERLLRHFESGLVADLQVPDLETAVKIRRQKAEFQGLALLPPSVARCISRHGKPNAHRLKAMLDRIVAFSSISGRPTTLELAEEVLEGMRPDPGE